MIHLLKYLQKLFQPTALGSNKVVILLDLSLVNQRDKSKNILTITYTIPTFWSLGWFIIQYTKSNHLKHLQMPRYNIQFQFILMLYFIFQKVEGEMSPVILTAFNNQPVDAILKEKEVWKRQVYLCRYCYKTIFFLALMC